jgi:hypothetical protein
MSSGKFRSVSSARDIRQATCRNRLAEDRLAGTKWGAGQPRVNSTELIHYTDGNCRLIGIRADGRMCERFACLPRPQRHPSPATRTANTPHAPQRHSPPRDPGDTPPPARPQPHSLPVLPRRHSSPTARTRRAPTRRACSPTLPGRHSTISFPTTPPLFARMPPLPPQPAWRRRNFSVCRRLGPAKSLTSCDAGGAPVAPRWVGPLWAGFTRAAPAWKGAF